MTPSEWEATLCRWAQSPGPTERERIEHAVTAVRKALDNDAKLKDVTKVFVQGSYRNRVNVRADSDVDLGVLYLGDAAYCDYPAGKGDADFGLKEGSYGLADFKGDIEVALKRYFKGAVTRGDKAFDIHENTYRIDADVVPVFEHRRYADDGSYICGVELHPDSGGRIINWPERLKDNSNWPSQHYENGLAKNDATGRCYRGAVRIFKTLRNEMDSKGFASAKALCGFWVECLIFNVPNNALLGDTWDESVQMAFAYLWKNTAKDADCAEWGEVSELKYFLKNDSAKRQKMHRFIDEAWSYVGVR